MCAQLALQKPLSSCGKRGRPSKSPASAVFLGDTHGGVVRRLVQNVGAIPGSDFLEYLEMVTIGYFACQGQKGVEITFARKDVHST